jgi:hypothetical protein
MTSAGRVRRRRPALRSMAHGHPASIGKHCRTDLVGAAPAASPASSAANGCRSAFVEHSEQVVSDTYFCDCCPVLLSSSSAQPWVSRASTEFTTSISFRSRRDGSLYGGSPTL